MTLKRQISLKWGGKSYPIVLSIGFLSSLEDEGIYAFRIVRDTRVGNMPYPSISRLLGACLRHAGADVDDEDILSGILGMGEEDVAANVHTLFNGMFPALETQAGNFQTAPE